MSSRSHVEISKTFIIIEPPLYIVYDIQKFNLNILSVIVQHLKTFLAFYSDGFKLDLLRVLIIIINTNLR